MLKWLYQAHENIAIYTIFLQNVRLFVFIYLILKLSVSFPAIPNRLHVILKIILRPEEV